MRKQPRISSRTDSDLERDHATLRQHVHILYGVAAGSVVAATCLVAVLFAASSGVAPGWQALAGIAALPIGAWYASRIAQPVVTQLAGPITALLPKLSADTTIPNSCRTLVVIPAIVATPERARELLGRLARLACEHEDQNLRFALLADFADAPTRTTPADTEILREEQRLVEHINANLRDESGDRIFVLHRERAWYAADRTWMGWERKRGKLLELHRLVLGRPDTSYRWIFGDFAQQLDAGGFTFVYTLDEANWLAHDEVRSLLRVAAHPANRAELDDAGRLVGGYAIFQPSIVPVSGGALTSAETIQRAATTRFHFDVLGVGVFQGKGLLDVRACNALLDDVFPPGAVLHHDMLEGFAARTAEVHDAFVLEVSAPDYLSQVQRGHRWLRGYFQALPWIMPRVRGGDGARRTNPLRPIHRFFIFELVLTELARPASLVLLLAGWLTMPTHALAWTVLVCPPLAVLLARLVATTLGAAVDAIRRALAPAARAHGPRPFPLAPLAVEALAMLFSQATLPYEAVVVADALRRATWRMLVTRRHLLEWTPVSRVNPATLSEEPSAYWRELRACHAAGLLTLAVVAALRPSNLLVAIPFVAAWIGAPWMVAWFDGALGHTEAQPVAGAADAYGVGLEPERGAA